MNHIVAGVKSSDPAETSEWMSLIPDFNFEERIGFGGMGEVFLAGSRATGRKFAAKVCRLDLEHLQKEFLRELALWIDLPEHPNIAPCYFFRSAGKRIVIFAEFYDSGSLERWIDDRLIRSVSDIARIALMMARGLAYLHDAGFLHRDFKPRNVLMSHDGVPKVADFGLAAALSALEDPESAAALLSEVTLEYRSPEQCDRLPLGPATDVWSWAVTVLHMFVGDLVWLDGAVVDETLKGYLAGDFPGAFPIPETVADLLRECLLRDPDKRLHDMHRVVLELKRIIARLANDPPPTLSPASHQAASLEPLQPSPLAGMNWLSPAWWNALLSSYHVEVGELYKPVYVVRGSRTARAVADLIAFDEIRPELERRAASNDLPIGHLAAFYGQLATVHVALGDYDVAWNLFDQGLNIATDEGNKGDPHWSDLAVSMCLNKAVALESVGNALAAQAFEAAVPFLPSARDRGTVALFLSAWAIHLGRRGSHAAALNVIASARAELHASDLKGWERGKTLATILMLDAEMWNLFGDKLKALRLLMRVGTIYEIFLQVDPEQPADGQPDHREVLSDDCEIRLRRADILNAIGRQQEAIPYLEKTIPDLEWLVRVGEAQCATPLSEAYGLLANSYRDLSQWDKSLAVYAKATRSIERLAVVEGRENLVSVLVRIYLNHAAALTNRRDVPGDQIRSAYTQAIPIIQRAVDLMKDRLRKSPFRSISHDLAKAIDDQGMAYLALQQPDKALNSFDESLAIYGELQQPQIEDIAGDIAYAHGNRAYALLFLGRIRDCLAELDRAMPVIQREMERTNRHDLRLYAMNVRKLFGDRAWGAPTEGEHLCQ